MYGGVEINLFILTKSVGTGGVGGRVPAFVLFQAMEMRLQEGAERK